MHCFFQIKVPCFELSKNWSKSENEDKIMLYLVGD